MRFRGGWAASVVGLFVSISGAGCSTESATSTECHVNSDCASNLVCLFGDCTPRCNADRDCAPMERCLVTSDGAGCVGEKQGSCDECPGGTVCGSDQICRTGCGAQISGTALACGTDQSCVSSTCVGLDPAHDPDGATIVANAAGGGGGSAGQGGKGGQAGHGGEGGSGGAAGDHAGGASSGGAGQGGASGGASEGGAGSGGASEGGSSGSGGDAGASEGGSSGSGGDAGSSVGGSSGSGGDAGSSVGGASGSGGTSGVGGAGMSGSTGASGVGGSVAGGASGFAGQGGAAGSSGTGGVTGSGVTSSVSVGFGSTCAIAGGDAYCWGDTTYLLHDPTDGSIPAVAPSPLLYSLARTAAGAPLTSIVTRGRAACASAASTATLVCWGDDSSGEVAAPPPGNQNYLTPTVVKLSAPVAEVHLTEAVACARVQTSGENVFCWGPDDQDALTAATSGAEADMPVAIPLIQDATLLRASRVMVGAQNASGITVWGRYTPSGHTLALAPGVDFVMGGITATTVFALDGNGAVTWSGQTGTTATDWSAPASVLDSSGAALGPASAISASSEFCAVSLDGTTVRCLGFDATGPTTLFDDKVFAPNHVVEISTGTAVSGSNAFVACVRLDDASSTIECWGDDSEGELGVGAKADLTSATKVTTVSGGLSISATPTGTAVLASDGSITAWGTSQSYFGSDGELAPMKVFTETTFTSSPAKARLRSYEYDDVTYVVDGVTNHLLDHGAPESNTRLLATGLSFADAAPGFGVDIGFVPGETAVRFFENGPDFSPSPLTNGATTDSFGPLLAMPQSPLELGYSAWEYYVGNWACARVSGGAVWCWGSDTYGQLGDGDASLTDSDTPVQALASGATGLCVGYRHACVETASGPSCWGSNSDGAASPTGATGSGAIVLSPQAVSGASSLTGGVACGRLFSCAWGGATVGCWGSNAFAALGDPAEAVDAPVNHVVTVKGLPGAGAILGVAAGDRHACALTSNGDVYCWGGNESGQGSAALATNGTPTAVVFP